MRHRGAVAIVRKLPMFFRAVTLGLILVLPATAAADRGAAKEQVEFGIKVAQNGLWKEATFRWEKATQIDPTYAEAWNNLAIGYEHQGRFEDAERAYQRALTLAPKNAYIRQNYELFKEINDRTPRTDAQ